MNQSTEKTYRNDFFRNFAALFYNLDIPMGLLRALLVIILFFYVFSLIVKLIFNRKIKKMNRQMEQTFTDNGQVPSQEQKNPRINPNIGEYTDFEEIE